jgi:dedicator of cytokinesis protein 1
MYLTLSPISLLFFYTLSYRLFFFFFCYVEVDLLGLLNWQTNQENIKSCLKALLNVDGEEVVKFLQDILDSLFNILMENSDTDTYDIFVFDCLLHIISLVSNDWKYQHFEPVLDLYIKESFSATLVHK